MTEKKASIIDHPLIILAGGKSSRMGRDKALLPFGGYPTLTQYQIARFNSSFQALYISCKSRQKFDFEANFIEDIANYTDAAPYIGLISVFEQIDSEFISVLSVDVPFFTTEDFQKLLVHITPQSDAIVARSPKGIQPLCAIYRRTVLPHLRRLTEERKYRFSHLFERIEVTYVDFEKERAFVNLNTPEDYRKAMLSPC